MSLTVVASGPTVKEVHLGYSRREPRSAKAGGKAAANRGTAAGGAGDTATTKSKASTKKSGMTKDEEADDEDNEIPGTVKSYNAERRLLVVSLLNGTSRSFFLARDLKVLVKGTASKQGVADPSIKEGAHVTVLVAEGGRRVRELHVNPLPPARTKKKAA